MAIINENTQKLLEKRYFYRNPETGITEEKTAEEMFHRVAKTVAKAEETIELQNKYEKIFFDMMNNQLFMPNTPTLIGAGYKKCLSGCVVLPRIPDSLEGIYQHMWKNANLTKFGCGIGQDFSEIRPKGEIIKSSGGISSGIVNWMKLLSVVSDTTMQGDKARRAANMSSIRFCHPDIFDFIHSKQNDGTLKEMNISVTITDEEMKKVINDENIDLVWNNKIYKTVKARDIFNEIINGMYENGEPGVLWLDTINNANPFNLQDGNFNEQNKHYMITTNVCGEQPLEEFEVCNLGSINLANLYNPKIKDINWDLFKLTIENGIKFLDNVISVNEYVFPEFKEKVLGNRKIGLGVAGFADLLIKLEIRYDSQECLNFIDKLFSFKAKIEQEYNEQLGIEKGNFLNWHESIYLRNGINARCAAISTQAPTGSIASILNTTAYGIEPLFQVAYKRRIVTGEIYEANELFKEMLHKEINNLEKETYIIKKCFDRGTVQIDDVPEKLQNLFRCANDIDAIWHLKIQAQIQKYFQNAISKTVNAKENSTKDELFDLLIYAWKHKIKGLAYYRNNSRKNQTMQIGNKEIKEEDNKLEWGTTLESSDDLIGRKAKIMSGCGSLHVQAWFDPIDGKLMEIYLSKGSQGGCVSFMTGLSRIISAGLRTGLDLGYAIDQLRSVPVCCSYSVRKATKNDVSIGRSCPEAIGYALEKMQKEIYNDLNDDDSDETTEEQEIEENILLGHTIKISDLAGQIENKCPECGEILKFVEGCKSCICGYSKCS
jgi:ribonucleoside-diphosphate reductase alpha chain